MHVKERLIRLIQAAEGLPLLRRELILSFDKSRRKKAEFELSLLVSLGYVNPIGTGRRGSPSMIVTSSTWPFDKCPLCGQRIQ